MEFIQRVVLEWLPVSLLKICVLITVAYLLSRGSLFRRLFLYRTSTKDKLTLFVFFTALALLEWWINPYRLRDPSVDLLAKQDISVNSGLVASVTAGLLIGPGMGFAVGFFTWISTLTAMSWAATSPTLDVEFVFNPALAAMIGGLLGGWIMLFRPVPRQQQAAGFLIGALSQAVWLSIGLLRETSLVSDTFAALIAPWTAAIFSGGLGVLLFIWIINDLKAQHERIGSMQIQRALQIANQTLPFLRQGLNAESARSIAEIVSSVAEISAVALTDGSRILAHVGAGSDHHRPGDLLPFSWHGQKGDSPGEIHTGREVMLAREQIGCGCPDCPLTSGVISSLLHEGEAIGGVVIYGVDGRPTNPEMVRLGVGLAQFFSNYQVELAELERQTQAASQAELKALQSQVHPHFLFNVLNTLAALCEIDPRQASKLTVKLGAFLRRSLRESPAPLIPLREEMENVRSYTEIEQARFQDRLTVIEEIAPEALDALVPSFGLQILAENAVLHGMSKKRGDGRVRLRAHVKAGRLWCVVQDEGPGFTPERQAQVFSGAGRASGLVVLRERGRRLLGRKFLFRIIGVKGIGTTVIMALPLPLAEPVPTEPTLPRVEERPERVLEPLS
ncbi:MAG: histidine kinase [Armatimonadetes bacterium]|nr:histidine kinase [Armatimonadota bacterium]